MFFGAITNSPPWTWTYCILLITDYFHMEDIMKALRLIYLLLKFNKMIGTGVHSHNPHTALSASP